MDDNSYFSFLQAFKSHLDFKQPQNHLFTFIKTQSVESSQIVVNDMLTIHEEYNHPVKVFSDIEEIKEWRLVVEFPTNQASKEWKNFHYIIDLSGMEKNFFTASVMTICYFDEILRKEGIGMTLIVQEKDYPTVYGMQAWHHMSACFSEKQDNIRRQTLHQCLHETLDNNSSQKRKSKM